MNRSFASNYFINSVSGSDQADGKTIATAWKTIAPVKPGLLKPGDTLRFSRGAVFTGPLIIADNGLPGNPIVLTDYGEPGLPAPSFTNPEFVDGNFGNCIRVKGNYVVIENLHFSKTAAYRRGSYTPQQGWDTTVPLMMFSMAVHWHYTAGLPSMNCFFYLQLEINYKMPAVLPFHSR